MAKEAKPNSIPAGNVIPAAKSKVENNFEAEIKENTNDVKEKPEVVDHPVATPVYRNTKKELERDKAPKYMFWYTVEGITGAPILANTEYYSPVSMVALTMERLWTVVESGFTAYWKHDAYVGNIWFNRPITKFNIKEFAWFINEEVHVGNLKLSELESGRSFYTR